MFDKYSLMVLNTNMNIIRDTILTLNGGMMHTDTLNFLTFLVMLAIVLVVSVLMVWAASSLGSIKKVETSEPQIITGAQE